MRLSSLIVLAGVFALASPRAQTLTANGGESELKVVLLGTMGGPTFSGERLGISTLVIAGDERLLFDAGRSLTTGLARLNINPASVTRVFLTHLHSDHIVSLPELLLFPWASQGRTAPLQVWGPTGTRAMMERLQEAFAFDIHVRRDVDERFSPEGVRVLATDIREGVVYESNGVKVTAFLVDHAPIEPAFGFRVEYRGRSVALSGDTKPSDNLAKAAQGVDLLVHEVGSWKQDPNLTGAPDDRFPGSTQTRRQVQTIRNHHTDGAEAGSIFERVKPRLAVFSHYNVDPAATLRLVRQTYAGPVEFGEDLMAIDIGNTISVRRFTPPSK
jgi:ribonuclease Z